MHFIIGTFYMPLMVHYTWHKWMTLMVLNACHYWYLLLTQSFVLPLPIYSTKTVQWLLSVCWPFHNYQSTTILNSTLTLFFPSKFLQTNRWCSFKNEQPVWRKFPSQNVAPAKLLKTKLKYQNISYWDLCRS